MLKLNSQKMTLYYLDGKIQDFLTKLLTVYRQTSDYSSP